MRFKNKFICFILLILISNFILPIHSSFASNFDSVYVWSNNVEETEANSEVQEEKTRKFFEYYFWKLHFNGSKNWASTL